MRAGGFFRANGSDPGDIRNKLSFVSQAGEGTTFGWDDGTELIEVLPDGLLFSSAGGCIQFVETPGLTVRWAHLTELPIAYATTSFEFYASKDVLAYKNGAELGVLDLRTGAKIPGSSFARWLNAGGFLGDNGRQALFHDEKSVAVVDATNDRRLWELDRKLGGAECTIAAAIGSRHVVMLQGRARPTQRTHLCECRLLPPNPNASTGNSGGCQGRLVSLAAEDGRVVAMLPWTAPLAAVSQVLVVSGEDVYVSLPEQVGGAAGRRVEVLGLPELRRRWRTPAVPCGEAGLEYPDSATQVQVTESHVFVCGCDGILRRFARDTGKPLGSFGVGMCHGSMAVSKTTAALPLVRRPLPSGGLSYSPLGECPDGNCTNQLLVIGSEAFTHAGVTQVVRGEAGTETSRCELVGTPFNVGAPYTVRIGDRLVQTDARGRFQATVRQRGILSVDIVPRERWVEECGLFSREPVTIAIDSKQHGPVTPVLRQFHHYVLGDGP